MHVEIVSKTFELMENKTFVKSTTQFQGIMNISNYFRSQYLIAVNRLLVVIQILYMVKYYKLKRKKVELKLI